MTCKNDNNNAQIYGSSKSHVRWYIIIYWLHDFYIHTMHYAVARQATHWSETCHKTTFTHNRWKYCTVTVVHFFLIIVHCNSFGLVTSKTHPLCQGTFYVC